jgi:hypothetical protein
MLDCKHIMHIECVMSKVKASWVSARIVFGFMDCPTCKQEISAVYCNQLEDEL